MSLEKDLVLIYWEEEPLTYARIEKIEPDHKKDWYHVTLLFLQVPLQVVTWILKDVYIAGEEFRMNGHKVRLEPVISPLQEKPVDPIEPNPSPSTGKIISFPKGN